MVKTLYKGLYRKYVGSSFKGWLLGCISGVWTMTHMFRASQLFVVKSFENQVAPARAHGLSAHTGEISEVNAGWRSPECKREWRGPQPKELICGAPEKHQQQLVFRVPSKALRVRKPNYTIVKASTKPSQLTIVQNSELRPILVYSRR